MYKKRKERKWFIDVEYLGQVYSLPQVRNFYSDTMYSLTIVDDQTTKQVCVLTVSGLGCRLDVWGIDNHYDYEFSIPFVKEPKPYCKELEGE